MAARGHIPSAIEGRPIQAPGMMRHGPFPGIGPHDHHPFEPLPRVEVLEKEAEVQGAEMERLFRENQRFVVARDFLRKELADSQQEMMRMHAHVGTIHTESDIAVRGLLDKIAKMEADIRSGEALREELHRSHMEIQSLISSRQEMATEMQRATEELQKTGGELSKLPEMRSELEGLRQEHQKLRATFEYEKGSNVELMERMRAMEKNLLSVAREVEKLRADVLNADKRTPPVPNPYSGTYTPGSMYPTANSVGGYTLQQGGHQAGGYGQVGQGSYPDGSSSGSHHQAGGYGQVGQGSYPDGSGSGSHQAGGYGQVGQSGYPDAYGRAQAWGAGGAPRPDGTSPYAGAINVGYSDAYGRLQQAPLTAGSDGGGGERANLDVYGRMQQAHVPGRVAAAEGVSRDVHGRPQQAPVASGGAAAAGEGVNVEAYGR